MAKLKGSLKIKLALGLVGNIQKRKLDKASKNAAREQEQTLRRILDYAKDSEWGNKAYGFYDEEVDGYITKENLIITFIAIVLGLIIGYFLTHLAILTVELEKTYLYRHITIESYLYATIISVLFTLVVNLVAHFVIKKINMIETLKTTE